MDSLACFETSSLLVTFVTLLPSVDEDFDLSEGDEDVEVVTDVPEIAAVGSIEAAVAEAALFKSFGVVAMDDGGGIALRSSLSIWELLGLELDVFFCWVFLVTGSSWMWVREMQTSPTFSC